MQKVILDTDIGDDIDDAMDSYWPMQRNMTVFGFGRLKLEKFLTRTPNQFTIGFSESGDFDAAQRVIDSAFRPLEITVGD